MERDFLAFGIVLGLDREFARFDDNDLVLGLVPGEFGNILDLESGAGKVSLSARDQNISARSLTA